MTQKVSVKVVSYAQITIGFHSSNIWNSKWLQSSWNHAKYKLGIILYRFVRALGYTRRRPIGASVTDAIRRCHKPIAQRENSYHLKAALFLANKLVTAPDRSSNTGPRSLPPALLLDRRPCPPPGLVTRICEKISIQRKFAQKSYIFF